MYKRNDSHRQYINVSIHGTSASTIPLTSWARSLNLLRYGASRSSASVTLLLLSEGIRPGSVLTTVETKLLKHLRTLTISWQISWARLLRPRRTVHHLLGYKSIKNQNRTGENSHRCHSSRSLKSPMLLHLSFVSSPCRANACSATARASCQDASVLMTRLGRWTSSHVVSAAARFRRRAHMESHNLGARRHICADRITTCLNIACAIKVRHR